MLAILWAGITLSACTDWMYDDRSGCEHGVCTSTCPKETTSS